MKNNKIKIILFLSTFVMLGSTANINAMKNTDKKNEITNKLNTAITTQDEKTQKDEEKKYKEDVNLEKIGKQMGKFIEEFLEYSENLTALKKQVNDNFFNKSKNSNAFNEKNIKKIKENYEKQKEKIKKLKNEYEAFLNENSKIMSPENDQLQFYIDFMYNPWKKSTSRTITEIEDDIKEIDEKLLSNPKFNFNIPVSKEKEEENSFDIDSDGSIFDSSSTDENEEKKEIKITKRLVNEYIKFVNNLKMQMVNDIEKFGVNTLEESETFPYNPILIYKYADLHKNHNLKEFDMEKFLQQLKEIGYLKNVNIKNTKFTMDEDLKEYLLLVLDDVLLSIDFDLNSNTERTYCNQNDNYIKFSNNIDKFKKDKYFYIDGKINEIDEDINKIYNENNSLDKNQIKAIKNKFNQGKRSIYEKIKEIFEDKIRHIFQKIESIDMDVPIVEEETKNLINQINTLIKNKFKNIKNKDELKNAVDEIFKESKTIFKSHNFNQMKNKEIKLCVKNYIGFINGRMNNFVEAMNYYSNKYKNIVKLKDRDLYNIIWLYFSVAKYLYFIKGTQEIDETKFLERLTMFNKNKMNYKLDEEDKNNLKKVFNICNKILNDSISKFFKDHEIYINKFKEKLSKIIEKTSNLNEMQKLCFFNKSENLNYKSLNKNIFEDPTETKKYKAKAIKKMRQIIKDRNNLNSLGLLKANNNIKKAEKFFKKLGCFYEYDLKLLSKAQILRKTIYIKHLNDVLNEMTKTAMSTINHFQDILLNNKKVNADSIKKETIKCDEKEEYIDKNLPIALEICKEFSQYKDHDRYFLSHELETEIENLQKSNNEFKKLKEKVNSLEKKILKKSV